MGAFDLIPLFNRLSKKGTKSYFKDTKISTGFSSSSTLVWTNKDEVQKILFREMSWWCALQNMNGWIITKSILECFYLSLISNRVRLCCLFPSLKEWKTTNCERGLLTFSRDYPDYSTKFLVWRDGEYFGLSMKGIMSLNWLSVSLLVPFFRTAQ